MTAAPDATPDGEPRPSGAARTIFIAAPGDRPPDIAAGLAAWRPGHLITDVPATWLNTPGTDPVTLVDNDGDCIAPAQHGDPLSAAAIVCWQT